MQTILLLAALAIGEGELPRSLAENETVVAPEEDKRFWTVGPRLGYIDPKDGSNTWLIGAQVRWHLFPWLAIEGAVDFHREEYGDDVDVWTIPLTASGIFYLPVDWKIQPYAVFGFGYYFSNVEFSGGDDRSSEFGVHLGVGAEWTLKEGTTIDASFRYLFLDGPPKFGDDNFDAWELVFGINFKIG